MENADARTSQRPSLRYPRITSAYEDGVVRIDRSLLGGLACGGANAAAWRALQEREGTMAGRSRPLAHPWSIALAIFQKVTSNCKIVFDGFVGWP
jgi:hypothetical protein